MREAVGKIILHLTWFIPWLPEENFGPPYLNTTSSQQKIEA
jgi:hypothetical protein